MRKIAFDISPLSWEYRTGVQNVLWSFAEAIIEAPEIVKEFNVIFYDRSGIYNKEIANIQKIVYKTPSLPINNRLIRKLFRVISVCNLYNYKIENSVNLVWNYDIYSPKNTSPVIYIHDILPIEYPQWFDNQFFDLTKKSIEFAEKNASLVICNSIYTKTNLIKNTKISAEKIKVVYPGIDNIYFKKPILIEKKKILDKYNLKDKEYIFSNGFVDPRKNLNNQIEGFLNFIDKEKSKIKYVITGLSSNIKSSLHEKIIKLTNENKIKYLGYVDKNDLVHLMQGAKCLMYCSIAEGFGLPIIEAMALGVPVITSNTTSMAELGKERCLLVDPLNVDEISNAITKVCNKNYFKEDDILSNIQYSSRFNKQRFLREYLLEVKGLELQ